MEVRESQRLRTSKGERQSRITQYAKETKVVKNRKTNKRE